MSGEGHLRVGEGPEALVACLLVEFHVPLVIKCSVDLGSVRVGEEQLMVSLQRTLELSYLAGENVKWCSSLRKPADSSSKRSNTKLPHDPVLWFE